MPNIKVVFLDSCMDNLFCARILARLGEVDDTLYRVENKILQFTKPSMDGYSSALTALRLVRESILKRRNRLIDWYDHAVQQRGGHNE